MRNPANIQAPATEEIVAAAATLGIDLTKIPPIVNVDGVNQFLAPMGRSLLYEAASKGEIETVSIGLRRGSRCYLSSSIILFLARRHATTKRPKITPRGTPVQSPA